jgi:hypothetical protein
MSSTVYKAAKGTGLSAALSVPASGVTITGFIVNARRLSAAVSELSVTVSVTTFFTVQVADASVAEVLLTRIAGAADAIKSQTEIAMSAADWSDESVVTVAPTISDVGTPVVTVGPPTPTPSPTPALEAVTTTESVTAATEQVTISTTPEGDESVVDEVSIVVGATTGAVVLALCGIAACLERRYSCVRRRSFRILDFNSLLDFSSFRSRGACLGARSAMPPTSGGGTQPSLLLH